MSRSDRGFADPAGRGSEVSIREVAVLIVMCAVWGLHFTVVKSIVAAAPPIFYAAIRMTLVAMILAPLLRWRRGRMRDVFIAGAGLGLFNYALLFTGLKHATASASAVAMDLYAPFAVLLSIAFLGERIGLIRASGVLLAFGGVAVIAIGGEGAEPGARVGLGVGFVAAAAFSEAVGAIGVKRSAGAFRPFELLAWFAVIGAAGLWPLTAIFETGQVEALRAGDPLRLAAAVAYSAFCASMIGHTAYYWLLQRLPVTKVAPATLLTTVIAVAAGVVILGEPFSVPLVVGAGLTITGVATVMIRTGERRGAPPPLAEAV